MFCLWLWFCLSRYSQVEILRRALSCVADQFPHCMSNAGYLLILPFLCFDRFSQVEILRGALSCAADQLPHCMSNAGYLLILSLLCPGQWSASASSLFRFSFRWIWVVMSSVFLLFSFISFRLGFSLSVFFLVRFRSLSGLSHVRCGGDARLRTVAGAARAQWSGRGPPLPSTNHLSASPPRGRADSLQVQWRSEELRLGAPLGVEHPRQG